MTGKEFAFPLPYIPPALAPVVLFFIVSLTKKLFIIFPLASPAAPPALCDSR